MVRRYLAWTALAGFAPYYALYGLLFYDTGLSDAQVSTLFGLWSLTGLLAEVPTGALADRWSRRGALALASVLEAAGFAVWTAVPGFTGYAVGFVVWGVGGALVSGAAEALLYDGLRDAGATSSFARVNGWATSVELLVQVPTALAASGLYLLGGYPLVGWVSVASCLVAAVSATRLPSPSPKDGDDDEPGLARGVVTTLRHPGLLLTVVAMALLGGLDAVEEYVPVMAGAWGVPTAAVPIAAVSIALAGAVGAALAGRLAVLSGRGLAALLVLAAGCLLGAALWARPVALLAAGLFYALYLAVLVVGEARLQDRISGPYRATVTSVAGLGIELGSLPVFAAWALGGVPAIALLVAAAAPLVVAGLRRPAQPSAASIPSVSR